MAGDPVDTVSVRLTADATDLLDQIDKSVEGAVAKGDELGKSVEASMSEALKMAGEQVRELAAQIGVSFEEAAKTLSERGLFAQFTQEQVVEAAKELEALDGEFRDSGLRAGEAFSEGFDIQTAAKAGESVRKLAQEMGVGLTEAAQTIAEEGTFEGLDPERLAQFAQGLDDAGILFDEIAQKAGLSGEQLLAFRQALGDVADEAQLVGPAMEDGLIQISPERFQALAEQIANFAEAFDVSFQEAANSLTQTASAGMASRGELMAVANAMGQTADLSDRASQAIGTINETLDFLGKEASPAARKEFDEFVKSLGDLEGVTTEEVKQLEGMADQLGKVAQDFQIADEQVAKVVQGFRDLGMEIPNALQRGRIRDYVRQLVTAKDEFSDVSKEANNFTDAIIEQARGGDGLKGVISQIAGGVNVLGINLGSLVGGMAVATAGIALLKSGISAVVQQIKAAIEVSMGYAEANRDLALAIRVNSVAGTENTQTFNDWIATAREVGEVGRTTEAVGIQAVTLALRELGAGTELTDAQINDFLLSGAKFDQLYGVKLPGGINQLTKFITTGFAQTLKSLGLDLGKSAQDAEAFALGLGTDVNALTDAQKETVRYSLLMKELHERTDAVAGVTETLTDRMAKLEERSDKAKNVLGTMFQPISEEVAKLKVGLEEFFTGFIGLVLINIAQFAATAIAGIMSIAAAVIYVKDQLDQGLKPTLSDVRKVISSTFDQAQTELMREATERLTGSMDQYEQAAEDAGEATGNLRGEMGDLSEEVKKFIEEANKFDEGMRKIQQQLDDALDDIETSFADRRAKAQTKLQRDLRDIDQDATIKRLDAIREYHIDEIRLREDHAKDIQQLEERYVLDLEDAVRDRDARQVLSLQRRFNLEKKNREEDFQLRSKRLHEDFQVELQEIERQRLIRRQERSLAFAEEMLDLDAQEAQRRAAAKLRADRAQRDLLEQIHNRLLALENEAAGALAIEQGKLDALAQALSEVYGPDGPWNAWLNAAVEASQASATAIAQTNEQLVQNLSQTDSAIRAHYLYVAQIVAQTRALIGAGAGVEERRFRQGVFGGRTGFQRGGSFIATGPTPINVGEGRPERVDITPLSGATGQPSAGFRGGGRGSEKMQIELKVDASEQLVVEMADQTMSEIADVYVTINQRGYQGGRGA